MGTYIVHVAAAFGHNSGQSFGSTLERGSRERHRMLVTRHRVAVRVRLRHRDVVRRILFVADRVAAVAFRAGVLRTTDNEVVSILFPN